MPQPKPNLYAVGLPIKEEDVTDGFLSLFEKRPVCLTILSGGNLEQDCCPYGYRLLSQLGYEFISLEDYKNQNNSIVVLPSNIWTDNGVRVNVNQVAQKTMNCVNSVVTDERVYAFIFSGSLRYYNKLFEKIEHCFPKENIIDTKSSGDHCYDEFRHYDKSLNLCYYTLNGDRNPIELGHVNLLAALGEMYQDKIDYDALISDINRNMLFYSVKVDMTNEVNKIPYQKLMSTLTDYRKYWNNKTLAIIT